VGCSGATGVSGVGAAGAGVAVAIMISLLFAFFGVIAFGVDDDGVFRDQGYRHAADCQHHAYVAARRRHDDGDDNAAHASYACVCDCGALRHDARNAALSLVPVAAA
jgi:hypothetical protein